MVDIEINSVHERDIDLLLIEELSSTPEFCKWFQEELKIQNPGKLISVKHSLVDGRETDVDLTFESTDGLVRVLVEDKVNEKLQFKQAEGYRERQAKYLTEGKYAQVITVLLAPEKYFDSAQGKAADFDCKLSYQKMDRWYAGADYPQQRRNFKRKMLERAIEKKNSIGEPTVVDVIVTEFRQKYWVVANECAGELNMHKPKNEGTGNNTIIEFDPPLLYSEPNVCLRHKMSPIEKAKDAENGYINLQFSGCTKEEIAIRFGTILLDGMRVVKAGKSAAITLPVAHIDLQEFRNNRKFKDYDAKVRSALETAKKLLAWYLEHRNDNKKG